MNLVKKTPVQFHWRLSTSLSYRGGEAEGADKGRGGGGGGGGEGARTDPRRREMFPLCIFFFFLFFFYPLPISSPPLAGVFCQSLFLLTDEED